MEKDQSTSKRKQMAIKFCKRGHRRSKNRVNLYGQCIKCKNTNQRRWRKEHPQNVYAHKRKGNLKTIGWTMEAYELQKKKQKNKCAICRRTVGDQLKADHKHITPPKPRGLLCNHCNLGLGLFGDNIVTCERAATYLKKYKHA